MRGGLQHGHREGRIASQMYLTFLNVPMRRVSQDKECSCTKVDGSLVARLYLNRTPKFDWYVFQ